MDIKTVTKRENSDISWRDSRDAIAIVCVFLIAITWFVFGQTLRYDFVNYDDDSYIYANPLISSGLTIPGAIYALSGKHSGNWHPLTTLSHMLDCQLWGSHAGGHHFTNIVLHTIAVVLLFLILRQMTDALWRSAFVAAVFAVHPLRVESVAWISERKDVLSAVFFMLTLWLYVRYVRYPSVKRYLAVVSSFALGLMCKPTLVTVPLILLLLDYWPLRRFAAVIPSDVEAATQPPEAAGPGFQSRRKTSKVTPRGPSTSLGMTIRKLIIEKVPLLALSAAAAGATLWAQKKSIIHIERLPFMWRVGNGLVTCLTYIKQMIWPARLAVFYPHPGYTLPVWEVGLAFVLLGMVSVGAMALRHKRPYFITGWFWYLIMLLPVIGLIQVGSQGHADRYTYLSQIGLYILLAWAIPDICRASVSDANRKGTAFRSCNGCEATARLSNALQFRILGVIASVAIILLAWCAHIQASYWRNGESLWSHAIAVTSENFVAHDGLGQFLLDHGRLDEAIDQFQVALNIDPKYPMARTNLGIALSRKGRVDEAITHLQTVLGDYPNDAIAQLNLGTALAKKGDAESAIAAFEKALSIQSRYPSAHYNLGMALDASGRIDEAIAHYQEAAQEDPHFAEAYYLLGNDFFRTSRIDDAIAAYERALQSRPAYPEVENNIGLALLKEGRPGEAIAHWENAVANESDFVAALNNLAWVLAAFPEASIRNGDKALRLADRANQLSGGKDPAVLRTLAAAYAENGRFTEATATAESGLQLANTQDNSALAKIFESDLAHYRANAPVRIALRPDN
jgi:protein O-mannosyl-transferase